MPHGEAIEAAASTTANDEVTLSWLKEILQALASSDKTARNNALTFLLPALVQKDASAAGVLAEANTTMETREEVMRRVAQLWAAQDSAGALAWATALPRPEERDATISDVCLQIARTKPDEAVRLRDRYAASDHLDHPDPTLVNLAQQWAEKNWTAALDWAAERPEGNERNEMISRLAFVQAQTSPANAARLILERIPPGETQTEAISTVLQRWIAREPGAASAWVKDLPNGPLRTRAVQEIARVPSR